jgi:hypothetical protein
MTLIELSYCVFIILCAYFLGHNLGHRWGTTGWLVGIPIGAILGILFPEGLSKLYYRFWPPFPRCRRGRCGDKDYLTVRIGPGGQVVQCRCGDKYLIRYEKGEKLFRELMEDGSTRPYLARKYFRKWKPDSTEPGS